MADSPFKIADSEILVDDSSDKYQEIEAVVIDVIEVGTQKIILVLKEKKLWVTGFVDIAKDFGLLIALSAVIAALIEV